MPRFMGKKLPQTPPKSFEEAIDELERILSDVEAGQLGLEETLVRYERGNFLVRHCREVLDAAERQIEQITRSADGGLQTRPLPLPGSGGAGAGANAGAEDQLPSSSDPPTTSPEE